MRTHSHTQLGVARGPVYLKEEEKEEEEEEEEEEEWFTFIISKFLPLLKVTK